MIWASGMTGLHEALPFLGLLSVLYVVSVKYSWKKTGVE